MSVVEILGNRLSPFVQATWLVAAEKGLEPVYIPDPPHSEAILAIHPAGKIPALRHGDVTLFESLAISTYLDGLTEKAPLTPINPTERAQMLAWCSLITDTINRIIVQDILIAYAFPPASGPDLPRIATAMTKAKPVLARINADLARTDSPAKHAYMIGETATIADFMLYPIMEYLRLSPVAEELFNPHGNGNSITYERGRGSTNSEGEFTAAFPGGHGWFWRNRDTKPLTVNLRLRGTYSELRQGE